jgi:hypothetical protein
MTNEGEVYFKLWGGNFDPARLSLGLEPTKTQCKGDPRPKHSSWIFSTGKLRADLIDVYEMSSSLISQLEPHADKIIQAMKQHSLEAVLEVVLTITTSDQISTPAIGFDPRVITFLSTVGASVDIDTYLGD